MTDLTEPHLELVQSISDDRGILVPFTDNVDDELFKRSYFVEDYGPGVIRGLHYHEFETKIFTVSSGAGKFVTVKLSREMAKEASHDEIVAHLADHPEHIKTFVLSSRHHGVLLIPPYFANGWISLEGGTTLVALSSLRFEQARDDDWRLDPFIIDKTYWEVIGR
jgi:dTDP-4-dehydrorhamnose 3,5-epimerase-like enzyme